MKYLVLPIAIATAIGAPTSAISSDAQTEPRAASLSAGISAPDQNYLRAYRTCAREAEVRQLSHAEATACLDAYTRLKLSFLPEVSFDDYARLAPEERWTVNQRAYAAYSGWLANEKVDQ
ncbi:MAG: hypothetical protein AAGD43_17165 [Pseudomonadota bacterium]